MLYYRAVTVCAPRLHKTEELRIEIQMWVKSIQKYIKVGQHLHTYFYTDVG